MAERQNVKKRSVLCQYCLKPAEYVDSSVIYNKSYGMIYLCRNCGAYVGVHKGSTKPKGTLANKELRIKRIEVHNLFDQIWKSRIKTRRQAYAWLASKLEISTDQCHIGMFDLEMCERALRILYRGCYE